MNMSGFSAFFEKEVGAKRAVDMLVAKLSDKPYTTEYPILLFRVGLVLSEVGVAADDGLDDLGLALPGGRSSSCPRWTRSSAPWTMWTSSPAAMPGP